MAHAHFAEVLGPRWWLSGQQEKLRSRLQPLLQAAQEARVLVDALQWATGAELYGTFFDLEVLDTLPQSLKKCEACTALHEALCVRKLRTMKCT